MEAWKWAVKLSIAALFHCTLTPGGADCADGLQFLKGEAVPVPAPGRVTVIELWAKWCSPCRQIFPHLTSIYNAKKASGLTVVGISIEDDPSLADFIAAEGDRMGYTVAVDKKGVTQGLMQRAGASGIPHAFVVDHTGVIVFRCKPPATLEDCMNWKSGPVSSGSTDRAHDLPQDTQ